MFSVLGFGFRSPELRSCVDVSGFGLSAVRVEVFGFRPCVSVVFVLVFSPPPHLSSLVICLSSSIFETGGYFQGSGYRFQESGALTFQIPPSRAFRDECLLVRVPGLEFRVQCPVFRVLGSEFRV